MKNVFIFIFIFTGFFPIFSQSNFLVRLKGDASAGSITYTDNLTLTLTGGAWNGWQINNLKVWEIIGDQVLHNTQYSYSHTITADAGINITENTMNDQYGNEFLLLSFFIPETYSSNTINIRIQYSLDTKMNLTDVFNPTDPYPIVQTTIPADIRAKYLGQTTHVESSDATIQSTALTIVAGKNTLKSAVEALATWIAGNIPYDKTNTYKKSTDVLLHRTGDCEGQSYLMAAFCRSLGIPARITWGNTFRYETKLALWSGTYIISPGSTGTVTNGNIGHSLYEVFYPQVNSWVRGDGAQFAINTGWSTTIKKVSGQDNDVGGYGTFSGTCQGCQNKPVISENMTYSTTVGSFTNNLKYVCNDLFGGTQSNVYIFGANDQDIGVGIYDKVKIQDPPPITQLPPNTMVITPGSQVSYYAKFTSGWGDTYALNYDWTIKLYYDGGTYIYAQQNGVPDVGDYTIWRPSTSGSLPNYNWAKDPNGNIYGEVSVIVHISDGDWKSDKISIGVICAKNIQNVTYTTSQTITGCKISATNVTIQNNCWIFFDADEIEINGPFEVQMGSTFETK